jgi:hypothetical protein
VSIVSNGSKITEKWFQDYGQFLDILAISCDSFDEDTNVKIGRGNGKHIPKVLSFSTKFSENILLGIRSQTMVRCVQYQVQNQHGGLQVQLAGGHERIHSNFVPLSMEVLPSPNIGERKWGK